MKAKTNKEIFQTLIAKAKRAENGCLICHIKPNRKGYSNLTVGGRGGDGWRAHRFVWYMVNGPIPENMQVCHSCDVRNCIEIEHLFLGTGLDNSKDMVAKNRVARIGQPATNFELLKEAHQLRKLGFSLEEIAEEQGLAGGTSVADRLRRYQDATST
jgi:HNH endonuclease